MLQGELKMEAVPEMTEDQKNMQTIDEEYTKLAMMYGDKSITMRLMQAELDVMHNRVIELKKQRDLLAAKAKK